MLFPIVILRRSNAHSYLRKNLNKHRIKSSFYKHLQNLFRSHAQNGIFHTSRLIGIWNSRSPKITAHSQFDEHQNAFSLVCISCKAPPSNRNYIFVLVPKEFTMTLTLWANVVEVIFFPGT